MSAKKYFKEIFEKSKHQDPAIDAIRAISALSIIAFHILIGIIQVFEYEKAKQMIFSMPQWLQPLWHGEKGVDAFFLLSALVIGISVFKKFDKFGKNEAKDFLIKKFFRIYPLFFVALALYTIGQWSYFGKYFLSNLFFLNNIIPGERNIIPVGWFLTVEVQYFLLLPAFFIFLKKTKYRAALLTTLFLSSIAVCFGVLLRNHELYMRPLTDLFLSQDRAVFSDKMTRLFYESNITRFGPFALGLGLAYLKVFYSARLQTVFSKKITGVLVLFVAITLLLFPTMVPMYDSSSWYYNDFSATLNLWVLATNRQIFSLGLMLLLLGIWYSPHCFSTVNKIVNLGIWRPLSKLAYPIYLFHFPFIAVAALIVFGTTNIKEVSSIGLFAPVLIFFLATGMVFLFSIPIHIYIERPLAERGRKSNS